MEQKALYHADVKTLRTIGTGSSCPIYNKKWSLKFFSQKKKKNHYKSKLNYLYEASEVSSSPGFQ